MTENKDNTKLNPHYQGGEGLPEPNRKGKEGRETNEAKVRRGRRKKKNKVSVV